MSDCHYSESNATSFRFWCEEAVTNVSNRGHTRERAIRMVAEEFGLPLGRVQKAVYDKLVRVPLEEYQEVKRRYLLHLDTEAARLREKARDLQAKRERLAQDQ